MKRDLYDEFPAARFALEATQLDSVAGINILLCRVDDCGRIAVVQ